MTKAAVNVSGTPKGSLGGQRTQDSWHIAIERPNLCLCLVTQSCQTFCNPLDYSPTRLNGIFSKSTGSFRQEYWSRLPFPSPGDLPDPGIKHASPVSAALQADSLPTEPSRKPKFMLLNSQICLLSKLILFIGKRWYFALKQY